MNPKVKEWTKRYLPAELICLFTSLIFAWVLRSFTHNELIIAFACSIYQTVVFYGIILFTDIIHSKRKHAEGNKNYNLMSFFKNIRNLILEFGPAEIFDVLIMRPAAIYYGILLIANETIGLFIGSLVANIFFFGLAIIAYELRKKHVKD